MGIRGIVICAFLPVFLVLGLLSAALEYYLVRSELIWGLQEESLHAALGTAAFLDRNNPYDSEERYLERVKKVPGVSQAENILQIAVVGVEDDRVLASYERNRTWPLNLSENVKQSLMEGQAVVDQPDEYAETSFINAIFPIRDQAGQVISAAVAKVDASSLNERLAALKNSLILRIVCLVALAIPVGWIFGSFMAGKIRRTTLRAEKIIDHPVPRTAPRTKIRELDDVNETIEILAALLEERQHGTPKVPPVERPIVNLTVEEAHHSEAGQ